MAIPGAVIFTLLGVSTQFLVNVLDNYRLHYIFEHEHQWEQSKQINNSNLNKLHGTVNDRNTRVRDQLEEYEDKFRMFEGLGIGKRNNFKARIQLLRTEIVRIEGMIEKVDGEIKALERKREQKKRDGATHE